MAKVRIIDILAKEWILIINMFVTGGLMLRKEPDLISRTIISTILPIAIRTYKSKRATRLCALSSSKHACTLKTRCNTYDYIF